jgi:hypothetical protein
MTTPVTMDASTKETWAKTRENLIRHFAGVYFPDHEERPAGTRQVIQTGIARHVDQTCSRAEDKSSAIKLSASDISGLGNFEDLARAIGKEGRASNLDAARRYLADKTPLPFDLLKAMDRSALLAAGRSYEIDLSQVLGQE